MIDNRQPVLRTHTGWTSVPLTLYPRQFLLAGHSRNKNATRIEGIAGITFQSIVAVILIFDSSTALARTWSDSTGTYSVEATFIICRDETVSLKTEEGKRIALPLSRLSDPDQRYVAFLRSDQMNEAMTRLQTRIDWMKRHVKAAIESTKAQQKASIKGDPRAIEVAAKRVEMILSAMQFGNAALDVFGKRSVAASTVNETTASGDKISVTVTPRNAKKQLAKAEKELDRVFSLPTKEEQVRHREELTKYAMASRMVNQAGTLKTKARLSLADYGDDKDKFAADLTKWENELTKAAISLVEEVYRVEKELNPAAVRQHTPDWLATVSEPARRKDKK